jgi:hypothetical protein
VLGIALLVTLRTMARRWRAAGDEDSEGPYGPTPGAAPDVPVEVTR